MEKGWIMYNLAVGIPSFFLRFNNMPSKRWKTPDLCSHSFLALVPLEFSFAKVQFRFVPNYFALFSEFDVPNQVGKCHCLFGPQSERCRKRDPISWSGGVNPDAITPLQTSSLPSRYCVYIRIRNSAGITRPTMATYPMILMRSAEVLGL